MEHLPSKEKSASSSKTAKVPSSPAKVLGSPVPWHGRPASPARSPTPDQEEVYPGNRDTTFEPQRPQAGARKWTFSPLNHARSLDAGTRPLQNAIDNTSMVYSYPQGNINVLSASDSSTSSSSLGYPEVYNNDFRNLINATGTSSVCPQLSPIAIGRLWEEAIASQETQNVQQLLKCGFNVCGDGAEMQRPPLILAVLMGNSTLIKLLLTAGANMNCTDSDGLTALHHAAAAGDRHPWPGIDNSWAAIFQIAKASSGPPIPETASADAKDFLCNCFDLDPKMRPRASQLLAHPFVAKAPEIDQKVLL